LLVRATVLHNSVAATHRPNASADSIVGLEHLYGIARPLELIGRDQANDSRPQNADLDLLAVRVAAPGGQGLQSHRWPGPVSRASE
jgi:hypothetical protein